MEKSNQDSPSICFLKQLRCFKTFFSEEVFGASPQGMGDEHYSEKWRQDRRQNKDRHHRSTTETECKQISSCKKKLCFFSVCLNICMLIFLSFCLGGCLFLFLHLCLSEIFCFPAYLRALTSNRGNQYGGARLVPLTKILGKS